MLLNRSEQYLNLSLPDADCLIHFNLLVHLLAVQCAVLISWELPGLSPLLVVYVILHFLEYRSYWSRPDRALIYRPSEGWVIIRFDGTEQPVEIESMHWNQFRWIILNLRGTKDKKAVTSMVFCPRSLTATDFRSLKKLHLLNR